jgi:hypothetical protein
MDDFVHEDFNESTWLLQENGSGEEELFCRNCRLRVEITRDYLPKKKGCSYSMRCCKNYKAIFLDDGYQIFQSRLKDLAVGEKLIIKSAISFEGIKGVDNEVKILEIIERVDINDYLWKKELAKFL